MFSVRDSIILMILIYSEDRVGLSTRWRIQGRVIDRTHITATVNLHTVTGKKDRAALVQ